jgi:CysZ protein
MLRDLSTATGDLFDAKLLRYVAMAALLGAVAFVGIWFGLEAGLDWWFGGEGADGTVRGAPAALSWLGALVTVVLAWFLFPAVTSAFVCLFLDRVAVVVERRHYPHLPPAPGLPFWTSLGVGLRFLAVLLAVNAALLVLMLAPPVYLVAWVVANGWLLGVEYFEVVALRRLPPAAAKSLRRRHGTELFVLGVGFALLFTVPLVNLAIPVWATAVMVHRFTAWTAADARR